MFHSGEQEQERKGWEKERKKKRRREEGKTKRGMSRNVQEATAEQEKRVSHDEIREDGEKPDETLGKSSLD